MWHGDFVFSPNPLTAAHKQRDPDLAQVQPRALLKGAVTCHSISQFARAASNASWNWWARPGREETPGCVRDRSKSFQRTAAITEQEAQRETVLRQPVSLPG